MRHPLADQLLTKMNGLGNEIAILDLRGTDLRVDAASARSIARTIAFDQLMVLRDPQSMDTEAFIEILNNDGSSAGACGNGTRCVAFLLFTNRVDNFLTVETSAGRLECRRIAELTYSVDMGQARFGWRDIPLSHDVGDTGAVAFDIGNVSPLTAALVNVGNPHAIFFVDDLETIDLATLGPRLEHHELFPERANITFAQVMAADHLRLAVWERGAGRTQACGSAACAALVAGARAGLTQSSARVSLPGGDLFITWREDDQHVIMTGPIAFEFAKPLDAALFESICA